jgi:raffinose/stachyose/melibiose transport system permease protein
MIIERKPLTAAKNIFLVILLIVYIFPFLITILDSFRTTQQFIENPVAFDIHLNFDNYIKAYKEMNFSTGLFNSVFITVSGIIIIVFFSSMAAYLFARLKWRINKIIFFIMTASMTIPFQVVMIPLVTIYGSIGFLNSRTALLFMYLGFGVPFAIFTFHGFIKGIPIALEEAAAIDGCSRIRTFFQIVLPLLTPVLATIIVLDVLWLWNDYLLPSLVLQSPNLRTLPLSTYNFFSSYSVDYAPLMASLIMTLLPVLLLYLFLQKYIIQGISEGAVKS